MTQNAVDLGGGETAHPMDFYLTEEFNLHIPVAGEIRQGRIVEKREHEILVDIGAKSEGVITGREFEEIDTESRAMLSVGSEIFVFILNPEDKNGNIILSYKKAAEEQDWVVAGDLLQSQNTHKAKVVGYNRGGLLVKVGELRGFIPNSQLRRLREHENDPDLLQKEYQKMVGQTIYAKVLEVDRKRNRLILSERSADKEIREAERADFFAKIKPDDVFEGRVVNLTDYGAFIDIGGTEGLVHLSELSWKRLNHPSEKVKIGDMLKVSVISIDADKQRVALSAKRMETDPWTVIDEIYRIGQLVEATIVKLTKFGAFARLNDPYELHGLIHISELSENHVKHPNEVIKPSQSVTVRIIRIDSEQRQLGLSLKQVTSAKYMDIDLAMAKSDSETSESSEKTTDENA